jgi:hypothetical protein
MTVTDVGLCVVCVLSANSCFGFGSSGVRACTRRCVGLRSRCSRFDD